ncbi:MAG: immune inhibitor A, partial [Bacteroidales bacterium]|nr:immune inhibitor A [Bacteroidales bacterium]
IKTLVDNTEMYFVPVINPDGYVYNQTTNPYGGGMWRKNRRDNGNGSFGVDPNRNYGYMWGLNNQGSSPDPWDETYRGTAAFSEPEIAAIRDFCEDHEFRIALNYHTYSNLLLYTWGYTTEPCEDDALLETYAELMTQDSHYTYGPGSTTIYETNGGSDDWMYGEQTTKDKIFAYTPELGSYDDGFWCPIDRIIPIAQENMIQNILAAALSAMYADVKDLSSTIISETSGSIDFEITRLGIMDGATFTVSLEPISPEILSVGDPLEFSNLDILESDIDSISFTLDPDIISGTFLNVVLSVYNGSYIISDTLSKIFGQPTVLFEDDCNAITSWTSSAWAVTTSSYHSPTGSITDSPYGNYSNNQTNMITLDEEIELANSVYGLLSFWAKWEIETGWDYVQFLISTNNGNTWIPIEGNYTVTGNEYQAEGEPVYDGFQTVWIQEEIDLSEFLGESVKFRFVLHSDQSVTEDGFYFDDFTVLVIEQVTTGSEDLNNTQPDIYISNPFPNPAKGTVKFNFLLPDNTEDVSFNIYNAAGQRVYSTGFLQKKQTNISFPVEEWEPGIYYYRIEGANLQTDTKKLIVIR